MKLFRDARYVTSSVFVGILLATFRSIVLLRILGPALMGAWKSALLFDTFSEFARAGVSRAMGLRVPMLSGQGNEQEAARIVGAASAFMLRLGLVLGLAGWGFSFFVVNPDFRIALRAIATVVGLHQPYYFMRELAAARHLFMVRAKETLIRSAVDCSAGVLLCMAFGLKGLGAGSVLAVVITGLYLWRAQGFRWQHRLDWPCLKSLARIGVPFSLIEAGYELMRRLDVLLMALILGSTFVGYYGISLLIMDFAVVLSQKGVSQVVSPHLLREFGRTGSFAAVAVFYEMPARLFSYILPPLLGIGTFFIDDFVRLLLPQYTQGIAAAQVTMWSIFFVALHCSINSFFAAADMIPVILKLYAMVIPAGAAAQLIVMKMGLGITGAAWATLGTLALTAAGEIYVARRSCGHKLAEVAIFLASLCLPLAACMALRSLVTLLHLPATFEIVLFLLLYSPVLASYEMKYAMLRTVVQVSDLPIGRPEACPTK